MSQKRKLTIEDLAAHERLALEHTAELPPQVTGMLDARPDPTYIAVNATQPQFEQRFSIGYAIGSYHLPRHYAVRPPWYHSLLNQKRNNHFMRLWTRGTRRTFHRYFDLHKQNELFALVMMISLGYQEDLRLYLEKHPDMIGWAVFFTFFIVCRGLKLRLLRLVKRLFTFSPAIP